MGLPQSEPLPLQTCPMAFFLKPMHPGGSLDHYYGPMPATCMAARIVTICYIPKREFLLVTLCCKTALPLAYYSRGPLGSLGAWAKFYGCHFPGSGCAVLRTCTHKSRSFVARGSNLHISHHNTLIAILDQEQVYTVPSSDLQV